MFQNAQGREITNAELTDLVENLGFEIMSDPTAIFMKGARPAYLAEIPGVPRVRVDELARSLNNVGAPLTDTNIQLANDVVNAGQPVTIENLQIMSRALTGGDAPVERTLTDDDFNPIPPYPDSGGHFQ